MSKPKPFFDHAAHRANANYEASEMRARLRWGLFGKPAFALSPRPLYGFRNSLLRLFGATLGQQVRLYPSVAIFFPWKLEVGDEVSVGAGVRLYNLGEIKVGSHVLISQGAHLCAGSHDHSEPNYPLTRPTITVSSGCWICADAFVGPGVSLGQDVILGARAVLVSDAEPAGIYAGNPAKRVKERKLT